MKPEASVSTTRARRLFAWLRRELFGSGWSGERGSAEGWRGAAAGAALASLLLAIYLGVTLHSGFGAPVDVALSVLLFVIPFAVIGTASLLLSTLLRRLPRPFLLVTGSLLGVSALLYLPVLSPIVLTGALIGALIGAARHRQERLALAASLALGAALLGALVAWLASAGSDAHLVDISPAESTDPPPLAAPNPGERGPYEVHTLFYGSGADRRRAEYGPKVALKTEPLDLSRLLPEWSGLDGALRARYWGFDAQRLPLNGRVWYPAGAGPFPLVLLLHGNHPMEEYSDPGFSYLGEHLASRGFIAAAIDENFLNLSLLGDFTREMPARVWLLLEHLRQWRTWSAAEGSPFHGKIDLDKVALLGHSRGGQAVAMAAAYSRLSQFPEDGAAAPNAGIAIKAVIALAPTDGYSPAGRPLALENVDYLVLHGGHDSDLPSFYGIRQYERVRFTDSQYHFKAAAYLYRGNHSQFNTAWGTTDHVGPKGLLENRSPRLGGASQRAAAQVYVSAFLEASLLGRHTYLAVLRDHRVARDWLPRDLYLTRFDDPSFKLVSDAEEDLDPTTIVAGGAATGEHLSAWKEVGLVLRDARRTSQGNTAVYLGWEMESGAPPSSYTLKLPPGIAATWQLARDSRLTFALARAPSSDDSGALDFTVQLSCEDGAEAAVSQRRFGKAPPPLITVLSKADWLESFELSQPAEQILSDYEIPIEAFMEVNPKVDPARIAAITFRFDRSPRGAILLDHVGFRTGTAPAHP